MRGNGNPYTFYNALNSVKNDLIWGPSSNDDDDDNDSMGFDSRKVSTVSMGSSSSGISTNNTRWSDPSSYTEPSVIPPTGAAKGTHAKGHARRQSTLSNISMSSNNSDGESEGGCDVSEGGDSGVEGDESPERAKNVIMSLRNHLMGLHLCLNNLTDTASFITECYQEEVNP